LGIRVNLAQFSLLVAVNALVGGMVGQERTVVPLPLLVISAPSWGWVVAANVLLGINQGLTWSTTVIMKIDLAGPRRRGLAMGLNEAAGYGAVAATALATGFIAQHAGLRPEPFFLGLAYAGLGQGLSPGRVFVLTSFRERALSACSQAGLVNNLNDGMAWGLFPLLYADRGLQVAAIGLGRGPGQAATQPVRRP
jgi:hypothetical protein